MREHGLPTDRKYLFVIDGAKALRAAIDEVFGAGQPVQRCRNHKVRNVLGELPTQQHSQALNLMRAAWKVKTAPAALPGGCVPPIPQGGVERRTHKVTRWRDADMVQRWVASAWLLTEEHFRRIDGHGNLWALVAILGRQVESTTQPSKEKVA